MVTRHKLCSISDCQNRHYANGYCSKHRARWKRHGDPLTLKQTPINGKQCIAGNCDRLMFAHPYCRVHYYRIKTHGDLDTVLHRRFSLDEFWNNKIITDRGCWEWQGVKRKGYGAVCLTVHGKKLIDAHRIAWSLANGQTPDGMILHKCDNPPCFNPEHLYRGTFHDNARDRTLRQRREYALNASKVQIIRGMLIQGHSQAVIASKMGVHQTAISSIKRGKTWSHVI